MHYRQSHELPYKSGVKEKFLTLGQFSLTLEEAGWLALGILLSYNMAKHVPALPLGFPYGYFHYVLPILVTFFTSKAKHPGTGLPLWKYLVRWVAIRKRKRTFYYRKSNIVEGGDRYF